MAWEPNEEIHSAIEEARTAREDLYKAIDKLETQNATMVEALEAVVNSRAMLSLEVIRKIDQALGGE